MEIADKDPKKPDWNALLGKPRITEDRAELAAALSLAQAEIDAAPKTESNPFFKSSYADLATVRGAIREAFGKHGLSVVQIPHTANGDVLVTTILLHKSGQFIEGTLAIRPTKNDPQGVGSAITYARRYSLMAFAGVAPDDDDGNAASGKEAPPKKEPKPAQRSEVKEPAARHHWTDLCNELTKAGVSVDQDKKMANAVLWYVSNRTISLDKAFHDSIACQEAIARVADGNREFPASGDNSLLSQVKEKLAEKAAVNS